MNRADLHKLIDTLPDAQLPVVRAYLEGLRDGSRSVNFLDSAPYDDDEYSERDLAVLDDRINEAQRGQTVSFAQVLEENGLI